jgi:hypothetical protein
VIEVIKVISLVVVVLILLALIEALSRQLMPTGATVRRELQQDNRKLAVLYAGLMGDVDTQFGAVADWYRTNGYDLLFVKATGVYCPECVAKSAAQAVEQAVEMKGYERIVFDGLSLGGRAAVDTQLLLKKWGVRLPHTYLLLEGAPMTYRSVLGPLKYVSRSIAHIPFGSVLGLLPAGQILAGAPKPENIEAGADRTFIDESVAAAKRTSLWRVASELKSFAGRGPYASRSLNQLANSVFFMWFDKDHETVDQPVALREWQDAVGPQKIQVVHVNSTHVGIAEAPRANVYAHNRLLGDYHSY